VKVMGFDELLLENAEIDVKSFKGVVWLSGFVSTEADIKEGGRLHAALRV